MCKFPKWMLMLMLAILAIAGCTEDNVVMPTLNTDGRVVGTVNGVVTDAANNALLSGVEVSLNQGSAHRIKTTDATGHYSFDNLDSGTYVLTFVWKNADTKAVADAYGVGKDDFTIPTLEEIGIVDMPTSRDFEFVAVRNMDLYPLNGGAAGSVFTAAMVPVANVTVVADFNNDHLADQEFTTTTSATGTYAFTGLPTGMCSNYSELRTLPFSGGGEVYAAQSVSLDLKDGGVYQAEHLILGRVNSPMITQQNWMQGVPFPVANSFTATFNVPMNQETFVAQLNYSGDSYPDGTAKALVPVTVTWVGLTVTVNPNDNLMFDSSYNLRLTGWSTDGQAFAQSGYVQTDGIAAPAVLSTNFSSGVPFPLDGTFTFSFNMPMQPATFVAELRDGYYGGLMPITATWAENVLSVNPTNLLATDHVYYLNLRGFSTTGQEFGQDWSVSTGEQTVPTATTNFDDVPVALDANLVVTFSEPMDPASFVIDFGTYYYGDPVLYTAAWSVNNTVLTINPTLVLDEDTSYSLDLTGQSVLGMRFSDEWTFRTVDFQDVRVILDNLEDNFPLAGNLVITFSQAMDPTSFAPFGQINLTQNGVRHVFDATWTVNNTVLTINPRVDFQPGAELHLVLNGEAANGVSLDTWSEYFDSFMGDTAVVISNNIPLDPEGFPLDGNLVFTFSDAMAPATVITTLNGIDDIHGVMTWSAGNTIMTFNPDVTLVASTSYDVTINGETAVGGRLDGGYGDTDDDNDYDTEFVTVGGLQYEWNNLVQIDGSTDHVPVDITIQLHFNMKLNLLAENTFVTLTNTTVGVPIAMKYTQPTDGVLQIKPDQVLPLNTSYNITYHVYSTLPGDDAQNLAGIVFTTIEAPIVPVTQVTGVVQTLDWFANHNSTGIQLSWEREPSAIGYYIYARKGDAVKNDYFRVATVGQTGDDLQTTTVNLATPTFDNIFDSRDGDLVQTPFDFVDGVYTGEVLFIISAYNSLGEGDSSTPLTVVDTIGPFDGAFSAQSVSVDNSAGTEPLTFTLRYDANEYLDHAVAPVVTITEAFTTSGIGDPDYVIPTTDITYEYTDVTNGHSYVVVTLTVDAGKNGAGDEVTIGGLQDTSGNVYADDDVPAMWPLYDTTIPSGVIGGQDPASADNSAGADPLEVTFTITASELLDETVLPVLTITTGPEDALLPADISAVVWTTVDGHTVGTYVITVPAAANYVGNQIHFNGITDLAGNVQVVASDDLTLE